MVQARRWRLTNLEQYDSGVPELCLEALELREEKQMPDTKSTEDTAKESLPGSDPEVNKTAGDKPAPPSIDEGDPATTDDGSGTSETD